VKDDILKLVLAEHGRFKYSPEDVRSFRARQAVDTSIEDDKKIIRRTFQIVRTRLNQNRIFLPSGLTESLDNSARIINFFTCVDTGDPLFPPAPGTEIDKPPLESQILALDLRRRNLEESPLGEEFISGEIGVIAKSLEIMSERDIISTRNAKLLGKIYFLTRNADLLLRPKGKRVK
jgi:hypothetical protein